MSAQLLITNAQLLDPGDGTVSEGAWLRADDGRITETGTGRPPAPGQDTRTLDAAGATVLPGLIDAHVHIAITTMRFAEASTWTGGYLAVRALAEARRMLHRGFTTIRDVTGADHGMARALEEGLAEGPRLIHGGRGLSQTGGHGDFRARGDDSEPCCQARGHVTRIADGVEAVRRAARDEFRKGAAHLKVFASGGVVSPNDEISAVQYSEEELATAVAEADNHNRYVTVHAYSPRAINRALRAGVRCVEHGNLLDDETISLLLERDAYLVPTLVCYDRMKELGKEIGMPDASYRKISEVQAASLPALERAHRAGVNVVFGTDLIGELHPAQCREFTLRAEVLPPLDILRSATTTAARLLGMPGEIGTLATGAHADLIMVDGNPLEDITVLAAPQRRLRHVVKGGVPTAITG